MTLKVKGAADWATVGAVAPTPWERPADWLPLPALTDGDARVVGLVHVVDGGSNLVSFTIEGATTVDWGDGTVENVATGVAAEHAYSWAAIPTGTATSDGFRQAVFSAVPQAGQAITSIRFDVLHSVYAGGGYGGGYVANGSKPIVDLAVASPQLALLHCFHDSGLLIMNETKMFSLVGDNLLTNAADVDTGRRDMDFPSKVRRLTIHIPSALKLPSIPTAVEKVSVTGAGQVTSFSNGFAYCTALVDLTIDSTASGTDFNRMFDECRAIKGIPVMDLSSALRVDAMFRDCWALETVPDLHLPLVVEADQLFRECHSLRVAPTITGLSGALDLSGADQMFSNCYSLTAVPLFDTSAMPIFDEMFIGCRSLTTVPLFDLSSGYSMKRMFMDCLVLESVPDFNTPLMLDFSQAFMNCQGLIVAPMLSTANCLAWSVGQNEWTKGGMATDMFADCKSLRVVPAMDFSGAQTGTDFTQNQRRNYMFRDCSAIQTMHATLPGPANPYLRGMALSASALDEVYAKLPTYAPIAITGVVRENINGTDYLVFTTATPHQRHIGDMRQITGATPAAFNCAGNYGYGTPYLITDVRSATVFVVDDYSLGATYESGGFLNVSNEWIEIDVSGNPGAGASDPTIATAKGWRVSG
jgi:hypothetical protein